jgi:2-(3-amino-3-carboxypropyl)histidine synthase
MKRLRYDAIQYAARHATIFGIILGTLGRQGNPAIVERIQNVIRQHNHKSQQQQQQRQIQSFVVLLSEITPHKLHLLSKSYNKNNTHTLCWVQVACPRLSVDWGHSLSSEDNEDHESVETAGTRAPIVLNPYELFVCLEQTEWHTDTYPMDYYSNNGGPWTNYHASNKSRTI